MTDQVPTLPGRSTASNKGDYGRALLVGGSLGMSGAISISALGALRAGAGLTTVATAERCLPMVAAIHPALMTIPLPSDRLGRIDLNSECRIRRQVSSSTAIAIGPGMGKSVGLRKLVLSLFRNVAIPMVVDADALNMLAQDNDWKTHRPVAARILTPHPGEFARLSGVSSKDRQAQIQSALELSAQKNVTVILKGSETVICHEGKGYVNHTGNPKMAVGGSGDLLTGIVLALICQRMTPLDACRLGAHLHGLAGDIAAARLGCPSVLATDLIEDLPEAFRRLAS